MASEMGVSPPPPGLATVVRRLTFLAYKFFSRARKGARRVLPQQADQPHGLSQYTDYCTHKSYSRTGRRSAELSCAASAVASISLSEAGVCAEKRIRL